MLALAIALWRASAGVAGWMQYWEQQAAIVRGDLPRPAFVKNPERYSTLGALLTGSPEPASVVPAAKIALRAPREFMRYAVARGVQYEAGADGVIYAEPEHVANLIRCGCERA